MQQKSYIRPPVFAVTRGAALLVEMGRDGEIFQGKKKKRNGKAKENPNESKDMKIMVQAKQLQSSITTLGIL